MRRLVLIFMMCLLPLQWSWAAAARVCEHEQTAAHFGHHEHRHGGDADAPAGEASASANEALQLHPDCHTCHGIGVAYLPTSDAAQPPWAEGFVRACGGAAFPEPPPGSLLRPPSYFVA